MRGFSTLARTPDQTVIDPYWGNVVYYSRFEDAATAESELSPSNITLTGVGGLVGTTTSQSKFGSYSGEKYNQPSGGARYWTMSSSVPFQWGTADYTVECWLYVQRLVYPDRASSSHNYPIVSFNNFQNNVSGGPTIPLLMTYVSGGTETGTGTTTWQTTGGTWKMSFYDNTAIGNPQHTTSWTTGQWNHFSCCRSGGTIYMSVNGVVQNLGTSTKDWSSTNIVNSRIGTDGYNEYNVHYFLDELRITRGIARYTSNFAVQTKAFPTLTLR
jgi:hypothetical protein